MMDADLRRYLAAVKADEPPASSADPRWEETELLARRLIAETKAEAALKLIDQEPARRKRWDLLLLTGLLREGLGDRPLALDALEILGDKLVAAGDQSGVRALLDRFMKPEPTGAAVRFLEFLARGEAEDAARIELLLEAIDIRPDDPQLHAELSLALERKGDAAEAREHRLLAIEMLLDLARPDGVGEDLLRIIEEDLEHAPARVGQIVLGFASLVPWSEAEPILDLALPELEGRAAGRISWEDLAPVASRAPATPGARGLMARYLRVAVARKPEPDAILEGSGIGDPSVAIEEVGVRLPKILALPPGAHVSHTTWGLGRVLTSDGESVTLTFPGREGHKMSFAMASRSLDRIDDDGLRVLAIEDPARLRSLAQAGDAEVLVRALRDMGGTATAPQLKPRLEAALPDFEWAGYWRRAKEGFKSDRRLDLSEAYRQIFRLAAEGAEAALTTLPQLSARAAAEGLGLLRKFLREHPEDEPRLKEHVGPLVHRWAATESLDASTRAQALCHAITWDVLNRETANEILEELIAQGLSPDTLALGTSQELLLDNAAGLPNEEEFLWRAVESRLPRLRERGKARLRELLGKGYAQAVEQRITKGADSPGLAARLIEDFAARPDEAGAPARETLLIGAIRLLERDLPDGTPERLLALLDAGGPLRGHFVKTKPQEMQRAQLESSILSWAGSERQLIPILEFARAIGLPAIADEYEKKRKARAHSLLEGKSTEDLETRFTIMSRKTYEKLETEMKRLALELRTSIPAAIEKARELGDLRENAEYEAAKLRQANAGARLQELINTLERTRLLESIEIDDSRVGVGTETVLAPLEDKGPALTYWILGEGDGGLYPGVLSYRAPLARPLLGKPVGSEVILELPDGPRRYRIESIARRVPA
jgi:transcription elongation factor GreA